MIAQITGKVVRTTATSAVIDVAGVGYEVLVPENQLSELKPGQAATLITYHHVRENADELFGFSGFEARDLFELLISVSGVGPRSALSVMSLGDQVQIRQAIAADNAVFISGAAGIGQRSAQRICSELKDKVGGLAGQPITGGEIDDEALEALLSLGYNRQQAARALSRIDRAQPSEDQVKQALKGLS